MSDDPKWALDELDGSDFEAVRTHSATLRARITELEAEVQRLREAAGRCATIVDRYLYRQHEKVEDVPKLLRAALGEQGVG